MNPSAERRSLGSILGALLCVVALEAPVAGQAARPTVGVAFGGGSARGLAHVGVIQWFEEHRIPIDVAAGTSMGGLIGGSFAAGMDSAALKAMIDSLNWDQLFGSSGFAFRNIRRKADARDYPARLEFGLKGGIVAPPSINSGQQVDLLLGRIAAPYYDVQTFDDLPTPFRAVAVDLLSAEQVVFDRGSLAVAMRATMSLPLIFPPVHMDGRVLVDGGAMNNVPADVVRAMGAGRVVAINVGQLSDKTTVDYSMFGLAGATLDAMMRASTNSSITSADVIINVPLEEFGSLDWRRSAELVAAGYQAAESKRAELLPLAVSEAQYAEWQATRRSRTRKTLPMPSFVRVEQFAAQDRRVLDRLLGRHVGVPFDIDAFETDLAIVAGLDRYETMTWRFVSGADGQYGLLVRGSAKVYAPPFMMLGLNLENTTSDDFRIALTGRYLAFDVVGSGSEVRIDATLGSDPSLGAELYRPVGGNVLFVAPYAGVVRSTFNVIADDSVVARYGATVLRGGVNVGANLGRISDVRLGAYIGRLDTEVAVGDPGLPELNGTQTVAQLAWRYNSQDQAVIPSTGIAAGVSLQHVLNGPDITPPLPTRRFSEGLTQLSGEGVKFWTLRERNRLFVLGGLGTSFDHHPLPTDQFGLGSPLHLGAYNVGELVGDHYYIATGGYLRRIGRLPDFFGGGIFGGGWLEFGDAFDDWDLAGLHSHASAGVIIDTLIGPVLLAGTTGLDSGRWRLYVGIGRLFSR